MKAYKGTDVDIKCAGFQFQLGIWVEIPADQPLKLCTSGFHFCCRLFDVQKFYDVTCSRYWEIEVDDTKEIIHDNSNNKSCCRRMRLVRELTFAECLAGFNLDENEKEFSLCKNVNYGFGNHGNYNHGNYNHGNNNHGNYNRGNYNHGNYNHGNNNHGNNNRGNFNQ